MADVDNRRTAPISKLGSNFHNSNYWFLIATILFFIVRIINTPGNILESTSLNIRNTGAFNNFSDKMFSACYIIILILVMVYFNSESIKDKCGTPQVNTYLVFLSTVFPWLSIFGLLLTFLTVMPGWKAPFSNTFGYIIVVYLMNGQAKLLQLLNPKNNDDALKEIIQDNFTTIFNDFGPENIGKLKNLHQLKSQNTSSQGSNNQGLFLDYNTSQSSTGKIKKKYNELARLILIKDYIAETVWYLLTGFLVINITNNYIMEQGCL